MDLPARYGGMTLLRRLAGGGGEETFLARRDGASAAGKEFVVKRLSPEVAGNQMALRAVWEQASVMALMRHRSLARGFGFGEVPDEGYYFAMEYVWGEDLGLVAERGTTVGRFLPLPLAVFVVREIAEAVAFLHRQSDELVHGDLSPRNIVVGYDGRVKILDFGLNLPANRQRWKPFASLLRNKQGYFSPERVSGRPVGQASDIFALGVLLYEFTTGRRLFLGDSDENTLDRVAEANVRPPSEANPGYPATLERTLLQALAQNPAERHSSAEALLAELDAFIDGQDEPADADALAEYMQGLFEDRLEELEDLLGAGYSGADLEQAQAAGAPIHPIDSPPRPWGAAPEVSATAGATPPPPPRDRNGGAGSNANVNANGNGSTAPSTAGPVTARNHQLRRVAPDKFEKAAEQSRQTIFILGIIMVAVAAGAFWYGKNYEWPWEGLFSDPVDPPDMGPPIVRELPPTVPVEFHTEPAGAAISINGVMAAQRTPAAFDLVPNGPNTVGIYLDGYETQVVEVEVGESGPADPLAYSLVQIVMPEGWTPPPPDPEAAPDAPPPPTEWSPPVGRVVIATDPPGAMILRNGQEGCIAPCTLEVPANQEQHLTARMFDHLDTVSFTTADEWIDETDTRFVNLTLRPTPENPQIYALFAIAAYPPLTRVTLNGESMNPSPCEFSRSIDTTYRLELSAPDYQPWARTYYPAAGRFELNPILRRIERGTGRYSAVVEAPEMVGTKIFIRTERRGGEEIGTDLVEGHELEEGEYTLIVSYTPPRDSGLDRRRTDFPLTIVPDRLISERFIWNDGANQWERAASTEGPIPREMLQPPTP
jgi:serine/threonine protein kinase